MKRVGLILFIAFVFILSGCESLLSSSNNSATNSNKTPQQEVVNASLYDADTKIDSATSTSEITSKTEKENSNKIDYTYHFDDKENKYFLDWYYADGDKIFNIDKNCGIFIACISDEATQNKLFETSLKKELQALGYNNIVLGSYSPDFDLYSDEQGYIGYYALTHGCLYMMLFGFNNTWTFEQLGGLGDSTSFLYIFDIASAFRNIDGIFDNVSYNFIVSAKNNGQSYNSSLVTFNGFMAKQIMSIINVHLTGEAGSEDSQTFFESGQNGLLEKYLNESNNIETDKE